jgi:AAA15 family ATPase/GTPase
MEDLIRQVEISNFKSLRNTTIKGCRRINLFIGRPNVGKSNILEALSLFTVPYLHFNKNKSLHQLIRCESPAELFYSGQFEDSAFVETSRGSVTLMWDKLQGLDMKFLSHNRDVEHYYFDGNLNVKKNRTAPKWLPPIRKYTFSPDPPEAVNTGTLLLPPFGQNLIQIIDQSPELYEEISALFKEYKLELTFDRASQSLKILKRNKDSIFLIPYKSIADTLQRIIFFKTAIANNKNALLLFEEPEAHSFPPYITQITQEMIFNRSNQYFIATHSPFILNDLMENAREELAVYMVSYKNHETKVKLLSDKTLHEIYQNGVDVFTNSELFV